MSFPIFPNCKITLSWSAAGTLWDGSALATSWKFLTEATVTRPLKFRHQHCSCSCHLGALFLRTRSSSEPWANTGDREGLAELLSETNSFPIELDRWGNWPLNASGIDVSVWTVPPSSMEDIGIECIMQCILLGPLERRTLSSYVIVAIQ